MKRIVIAISVLLLGLLFCSCACAESIIAGGDCSAEGYTGITWQLTADGTLTISGTGEMDSGEMDSNGFAQQPWAAWLDQIQKVVVEEGITSIDHNSFTDCTALTEVSLPEGLTTIGSEAFLNCTSLTAIHFPDSLNNMYARAFHGCTGIRELTVPAFLINGGSSYSLFGSYFPTTIETIIVPEGTTHIPEGYFKNCSLTSITLPASLEQIDYNAFSGCNRLTKVYITDLSAWLDITFDMYYSNPLNCSNSELYVNGELLTELHVPEGTAKVSAFAFCNYDKLTSVTYPASLHTIDDYAFYDCSSLITVTLDAASAQSCSTESGLIGEWAFAYCSKLEKIDIPENAAAIEDVAFQYCSKLEAPTLPDGLTTIGSYAFSGCRAFTTVTVPASATLVDEHAYEDCTGLTEFVFEGNNTVLGNYVFVRCTALTSLTVPGSVVDGTYALNYYLSPINAQLTKVTILDGATKIGSKVFDECVNLEEVHIPNSVTSVPTGVFSKASRISTATVPGCMLLGTDASPGVYLSDFFYKYHLIDITVADGVTRIGPKAFKGMFDQYSNSGGSVYLPDSVTTIGDEAFAACINLSSIRFSSNLTSVGTAAFSTTGVGSVSIDSLSDWLDISFADISANPLYDTYTGLLIGGEQVKEITIPEGVTAIKPYAFYGYRPLTKLTLPEGVTDIGTNTFMNCYGLTDLSLPKTLTSIGNGAFKGCSGLSSIVLYENVSSVGDEAFSGCGTMDVIIPGQMIPTFGTDAFASTTPTVYCYSYSDADFWAAGMKYAISYLNATGLPLSLTLPADTTLNVGNTLTVTPTIYPADPDAVFSWSSSDAGVVSVEGGVLTAHAPGKATITATCGSCTDSMVITSYIRLTDFELEDQVLIAKEILQLKPQNLQPAGADPTFSWSSADTSIVSVSVNGYITGVKPGTTQVTASAHGISRSCTVRVCYPVSAVSFTQSAYTLYVDDRQQLTANVTTRDGDFVNQLVTFTTSNPEVATVSEAGLVTVHAAGSVTITAAAASGVSATCTITASDYLTLTLPAKLTAISDESLMNTGAEAVRLPAGCTTIGEKAFANSSRLLAVYMPDSITTIAANAFDGCTSVKFICDSDNAAARYAREHGIPCVIR